MYTSDIGKNVIEAGQEYDNRDVAVSDRVRYVDYLQGTWFYQHYSRV